MSNPYVLPDLQWWDIAQEKRRRQEALYRLGEYSLFTLMWSIRDFEAGFVQRCSVCYLPYGEIAATYEQPALDKCASCFGTTFEGGIKAQLVRPAIWKFSEEQVEVAKRGDVETQQATVVTTGDFRAEPHDYVFRGDGNRFRISGVEGSHLVTGFGVSGHGSNAVGFTYQTARANPSDSAYLMPPAMGVLETRLDPSYARQPQVFADLEQVHGPVTF